MIVIRQDKNKKSRIILDNVLFFKPIDSLTIQFSYHDGHKFEWKFGNEDDIDYCLKRIDEILDNNTFGSFVIMKDTVEPIPSSY